jgi:hypothetical protein
LGFWIYGYEMLFTGARTSPFDMPFSWRPDMRYIFVQMSFPMFHEFDLDGTIRTNGLHWEGFPRLAWEALSAAGYTTPPTYEVSEFERYGVPHCRVIITVLPHPDHADWFDLSFVYWGFITHEVVESAALRVLTDFCDHNPTMLALSPFGLFPAVSPHDPAWLDCMDHLRELLLLAESLDVTQTLARCLHTSGAALQYRSDYRAASGGS